MNNDTDTTPTCEGDPVHTQCDGPVRRYHVLSWDDYWYCDAHAQHDRDNGLVVEEMRGDE